MSVPQPEVRPTTKPLQEVDEWPKDCPPMPREWGMEEMGFERRPMVCWFDPGQLALTGIQTVISAVFGSYADRREVQAALAAQDASTKPFFDYSDREELWFDYIADLGDGFDATYWMARQIAQEKLNVPQETTRGEFVILGGDQVYPTASREEYQNRMNGPYRAAMPWSSHPPTMFSVPGNHDWYDGLTSFTRLYTQQRWIGGWKTEQNRSYFAIKLPHDWWIWAIDVQLASDVDHPQIKYFENLAANVMKRGSKIILCTAEPTWVYHEMKGPESYFNLAIIEEKLIARYDHKHVVGLAGDLHTYARYENGSGEQTRQRFITGGGGAYLYPTHALPKKLDLPEDHGKEKRRYGQKSVFPEIRTSRFLAWGTAFFTFQNWKFAGFIGSLYLLIAWALQSTSIVLEGIGGSNSNESLTFVEELARATELRPILHRTWDYAFVSPFTMFMVALLVYGLYAFADIKNPIGKVITGVLHAAAHLSLLLAVLWAVANFNIEVLRIATHARWFTLVFAAEMFLVGGFFGTTLMGFYLWLTNRLTGAHTNEVFSCQAIPHYKNFVRMHLAKDGTLTLYPIGVKKVPTSWELWMDAHAGEKPKPGTEWIVPKSEKASNRAMLIEKPIVVKW